MSAPAIRIEEETAIEDKLYYYVGLVVGPGNREPKWWQGYRRQPITLTKDEDGNWYNEHTVYFGSAWLPWGIVHGMALYEHQDDKVPVILAYMDWPTKVPAKAPVSIQIGELNADRELFG